MFTEFVPIICLLYLIVDMNDNINIVIPCMILKMCSEKCISTQLKLAVLHTCFYKKTSCPVYYYIPKNVVLISSLHTVGNFLNK